MLSPAAFVAFSALSLSVLPLATADDARSCSTGYESLDPSLFKLKDVPNNYYSSLSKIFENSGKNVSVPDVLDSGNRDLVKESNSGTTIELWAWNSGDESTEKWYPQGITSSGDALGSGEWESREAWLVSWYQNQGQKNVRISFVDRSTHKYRHALLVEPTSDSNFTSVPIHAGGIVWYGNALYVVDTKDGLRVFDLDNIWEVDIGDGLGRQSSGEYTANSYRYVIPQVRWTAEQPSTSFQHSWVSLDRSTTPDSLLIGEYATTDVDTPIRLVRYSLDYTTRELKTSSGVATSTFAHCVDILRMQGGFSMNSTYYLDRSNGKSTGGDLFTWKVGEDTPSEQTSNFLPGPEDLSYNPSRGEYYTVNEHPGERYIAVYKI
ncbi:hypothetical protein MPDQ_000682 [Monascus purpureus]|uniref:Secreted protein n=1 Tax=Monascus purpureus TaxID=5098 RepID=A0A507QTF3_MONPU|nr:hypothetical protein MPDQ_000682 [Monascus purpureus]BDD55113.1 hypothetical protein MAP00_000665 [Monascus purpureus]